MQSTNPATETKMTVSYCKLVGRSCMLMHLHCSLVVHLSGEDTPLRRPRAATGVDKGEEVLRLESKDSHQECVQNVLVQRCVHGA